MFRDLESEELQRKVRQQGRCVSSPTQDAWFPAPARGAESLEHQRRQAAAACTGCAVRTECLTIALDYELNDGTSWGVWGGVCPRDRQQAINDVRQQPHHRAGATDLAHQILTMLSQDSHAEPTHWAGDGTRLLSQEDHPNECIA
ncbi:WhiB family transcriptional regulator [Saccharopolyspora sp. NPDC002376]